MNLRGQTQTMRNYIKSLKPVAKATFISTTVTIVAGALVPSANKNISVHSSTE
jgi:hypothetical protein